MKTNEENKRRVLYFDMDGTLVDFKSAEAKLSSEQKASHPGHIEDIEGVFSMMDPMPGAVEAVKKLSEHYDCHILSTAPWDNPSAWSDKVKWVQKHFGKEFYKKVTLTHHKELLNDGYSLLIDDRKDHGADAFGKNLIEFNKETHNWDIIPDELIELAKYRICTADGRKWFCLSNDWKEGEKRWSLELSENKNPEKTLLAVGVNPGGKTDPEKNNIGRTIAKVLSIARDQYQSILFVNLTPVIALNPEELKIKESEMKDANSENIRIIHGLIVGRNISDVLLCYGNSFKYGKDIFPDVLKAIQNDIGEKVQYKCLGISSKSYPNHPLVRGTKLELQTCSLDVNNGKLTIN